MAALPEISKKWWTSEKPKDIKGQDLEKALASAEKALEAADKKGDEDSIDACLASLKSLGTTADKTIKKECDKKKHKDLIAVLEKYEDVIDEEVERLNDAKAALSEGADKDDEDDEDSKGKLFEPDYLVKMIKLLKTGKQLNFSFGLDKESPENSCLLLCRKRQPDRLYKMMKSKTEFSKRLMTYGQALGDGKMLQFTLADNAKEPAQICKTAKKYLRKNPELKFKKLRVICGGQNFDEDMEGEGAPGGDLNKELERVQVLVAVWENALKNVSDQINALREKLNKETDPALLNVSEGLGNVVSQFPDLDLSKLVDAAKSNDHAAYNNTLTNTMREVQQAHDLLDKGPLLSTIDLNPLVKTNVHDTMNTVLKRITDELRITA